MRSKSQSQSQQTKIRKETTKFESLFHPAKTTGILAWWNFYKNMLPILSSVTTWLKFDGFLMDGYPKMLRRRIILGSKRLAET